MTSKLKIVRWMTYFPSCLVLDINEATMLLKNEPTTILLLFPFVPSKKLGSRSRLNRKMFMNVGMRIMMKHKAKHEHSCCLIGGSQCNSQTFKRHQLNPTPNPKLNTCSANTARQWDFFATSCTYVFNMKKTLPSRQVQKPWTTYGHPPKNKLLDYRFISFELPAIGTSMPNMLWLWWWIL